MCFHLQQNSVEGVGVLNGISSNERIEWMQVLYFGWNKYDLIFKMI